MILDRAFISLRQKGDTRPWEVVTVLLCDSQEVDRIKLNPPPGSRLINDTGQKFRQNVLLLLLRGTTYESRK